MPLRVRRAVPGPRARRRLSHRRAREPMPDAAQLPASAASELNTSASATLPCLSAVFDSGPPASSDGEAVERQAVLAPPAPAGRTGGPGTPAGRRAPGRCSTSRPGRTASSRRTCRRTPWSRRRCSGRRPAAGSPNFRPDLVAEARSGPARWRRGRRWRSARRRRRSRPC